MYFFHIFVHVIFINKKKQTMQTVEVEVRIKDAPGKVVRTITNSLNASTLQTFNDIETACDNTFGEVIRNTEQCLLEEKQKVFLSESESGLKKTALVKSI